MVGNGEIVLIAAFLTIVGAYYSKKENRIAFKNRFGMSLSEEEVDFTFKKKLGHWVSEEMDITRLIPSPSQQGGYGGLIPRNAAIVGTNTNIANRRKLIEEAFSRNRFTYTIKFNPCLQSGLAIPSTDKTIDFRVLCIKLRLNTITGFFVDDVVRECVLEMSVTNPTNEKLKIALKAVYTSLGNIWSIKFSTTVEIEYKESKLMILTSKYSSNEVKDFLTNRLGELAIFTESINGHKLTDISEPLVFDIYRADNLTESIINKYK
ncbi:MAG: hypothetical protein JNM06_17800 [Blastocatellia bacterium]|nr:hypothetical protein [Blastocatellia bacterium]